EAEYLSIGTLGHQRGSTAITTGTQTCKWVPFEEASSLDSTDRPFPPRGLPVCTGPDFKKISKRNRISPDREHLRKHALDYSIGGTACRASGGRSTRAWRTPALALSGLGVA